MRCIQQILLVILLTFGGGIFAQNIGGGLVLGGIASQVDGDASGGFRQPGVSFGAYVNYSFSDRLYFQPEILFQQLGARDAGGFFGIRTNHVSIPLLLGTAIDLNLGDSRQAIEIQAGPVIGVLLSANDQISGDDYTSVYDPIDFRAVAGISYRMGNQWSVNFRYGRSIVSFLRTGFTPIYLISSTRGLFHRYVSLSLRVNILER